jgi:hypothetical protein
MSLNTIENVHSEKSTARFLATSQLKLNRLKSETIHNKKTKSELNLIYLEDSVILQVKEKNKPSDFYYGFDLEVAKRIKSAWEWEAEDELIAIAVLAKDIASTSEDALFVMGCDLKTWEIPFKSLSCFNQVSPSERGNFEIDEDGSYLYWKNLDLYLDLEDFKTAVDPDFKAQLLAEKQEYGKSFGRAIAIVRKAHKLNQDAIDGISDRHLRRIENEGQQPTLDVLKKLAKAHRISLEDYLAEVNEALVNINL